MLGPSRACLAAAVAVLITFCVGPAAAIYEDQAGTFDWYKQFIGRPQTVLFTPGKERVFLITQQNLLTSLQTKAGSVAWRRQYTEQDSLDNVLILQSPAVLLAASNGGKTLRAWDVMEGGFRWVWGNAGFVQCVGRVLLCICIAGTVMSVTDRKLCVRCLLSSCL